MTKNSVVIDAIARKHEFSKSKSKIMSRTTSSFVWLLSCTISHVTSRLVKVYSAAALTFDYVGYQFKEKNRKANPKDKVTEMTTSALALLIKPVIKLVSQIKEDLKKTKNLEMNLD